MQWTRADKGQNMPIIVDLILSQIDNKRDNKIAHSGQFVILYRFILVDKSICISLLNTLQNLWNRCGNWGYTVKIIFCVDKTYSKLWLMKTMVCEICKISLLLLQFTIEIIPSRLTHWKTNMCNHAALFWIKIDH